jgi:hypothetical protein
VRGKNLENEQSKEVDRHVGRASVSISRCGRFPRITDPGEQKSKLMTAEIQVDKRRWVMRRANMSVGVNDVMAEVARANNVYLTCI